MAQNLVSIAEAAKALTKAGDEVDRTSLSRYVKRYADDLRPIKQGNATLVDFALLAEHRAALRAAKTEEAFGESSGLVLEQTLKIRSQRLRIELDLGTKQGVLTSTMMVENMAHAAIGTMRNVLSQSAGDMAEAIAKALKVEPQLIRPHIRQFERMALAAFVRELQAART